MVDTDDTRWEICVFSFMILYDNNNIVHFHKSMISLFMTTLSYLIIDVIKHKCICNFSYNERSLRDTKKEINYNCI